MAQQNLGHFYCTGQAGLAVDTTKGLYWLGKAAQKKRGCLALKLYWLTAIIMVGASPEAGLLQ